MASPLPPGSRCGYHDVSTESGRCATCDENLYRYGDGNPLSEADIDKLVTEAEVGYDVSRLGPPRRPRSVEQRTLAAEIRWVEEGHRARLAAGQPTRFVISSDTLPKVTYKLGVSIVGETVVFTCDHSTYDRTTCKQVDGRQPTRTFVPCKHGAGAARRLEREGLLRWEAGRWVGTAKVTEDPFAGLPR